MSLVISLRQEVARSLATTPGTMAALYVGVCVSAVIFLLAVVFGVQEHRNALKVVCSDSAPSIVAAQHIKYALSDLDANAANEMIPAAGQAPGAVKAYNDRRQEITDNLVAAAENITYGDAERIPIRAIENNLSHYEAFITRARALHEAGNPTSVDAYLQATSVMHQTLLPAADALDAANRKVLDDVYSHQRFWSNATSALVVLAGALLLGSLGYLQVFVARRTRRTFNRGLIGSASVVVVFLVMTLTALVGAAADLKWAKEDAFDSVHALWMARALAYDANGAESRWLVARPVDKGAADYQQEFFDKSALVAKLPAGKTCDAVADACKQAGQQGAVNKSPEYQKAMKDFTGKLADELNNITFANELDSACADLKAWGAYMAIDTRIRQLETAGRHADAAALCTGDSNRAFDQFDKALDATIDINQKQFEMAYKSGIDRLSLFEGFGVGVTIVICVLAFAGLRPRFQEYA